MINKITGFYWSFRSVRLNNVAGVFTDIYRVGEFIGAVVILYTTGRPPWSYINRSRNSSAAVAAIFKRAPFYPQAVSLYFRWSGQLDIIILLQHSVDRDIEIIVFTNTDPGKISVKVDDRLIPGSFQLSKS